MLSGLIFFCYTVGRPQLQRTHKLGFFFGAQFTFCYRFGFSRCCSCVAKIFLWVSKVIVRHCNSLSDKRSRVDFLLRGVDSFWLRWNGECAKTRRFRERSYTLHTVRGWYNSQLKTAQKPERWSILTEKLFIWLWIISHTAAQLPRIKFGAERCAHTINN